MSNWSATDECKARGQSEKGGGGGGGEDTHLSVVVLGASGDLAKKMVFPSLFALHWQGLLPKSFVVIGHARSALSDTQFKWKVSQDWAVSLPPGQHTAEWDHKEKEFLGRCFYHQGQYDQAESFADLDRMLREHQPEGVPHNRLWYLAIPPFLYADAIRSITEKGMSKTGWNRFVVEKPFGKDAESSAALSQELGQMLREEDIYRIDHYLGKEMVQNLLVLRFANQVFKPMWNRDHVANVRITLEENFGAEGRGGYFDEFGIIRDVMQNHLIQILALVAMEDPQSLTPIDVQAEKVKLLRSIPFIKAEDIIVGQYQAASPHQGDKEEGKEEKKGYTQDPSVPNKHSTTPTFAVAELRINNERWQGVPFILKCGKALDTRKAEVRIQFKTPKSSAFFGKDLPPNELVLRVQPDEAVYLKMITKNPGLKEETALTELDLTYKSRFEANGHPPHIPAAHERLILAVIRGDHRLFVGKEELAAAWDIFTPILHYLEKNRVKPIPYSYGSRGPKEADEFIRACGFRLTPGYQWPRLHTED